MTGHDYTYCLNSTVDTQTSISYLVMCTFLWHLTLLSCTAHVLISWLPPGSLDCLQGRSTSLSSDDVVGLGHEGSRLSQLSLIPRSSTLPCDAPSASRTSQRPSSQRTSSPDSEMVTLEEFLQESNALSPPTVSCFYTNNFLTLLSRLVCLMFWRINDTLLE